MENIVLATFKEESKAYQAYSDIKNDPVNDTCTISQIALLKKTDGKLAVKENFDSGVETTDDTMTGGLLGMVAGVLGGPFGMLLGAGMGMMLGSAFDLGDAADNSSCLEQVASGVPEGGTALAAVVIETDEAMLNSKLEPYGASVTRFDAAVVQEEAEEAARVQEKLAAEARAALRKEKSAERKARIEEIKAKAKEKFKL